MPIPENFKYDMRVRERMLRRGLLTESELTKHVDGLTDVSEQAIEVELKQPALVKESERETRVVPRASSRPMAYVPSVRSLENELNDIDDDDDDDLDDLDDEEEDDLDAKAKPKAEAAAPAAKAEPAPAAKAEPAPAPAAAPAAEDEGWESET